MSKEDTYGSKMEIVVNCDVYDELKVWAEQSLAQDLVLHLSERRIDFISRLSKLTPSLIGVERKLSYKPYYNIIIENLGEYKKETFPALKDGLYRNIPYSHILPISNEKEKENAVRKYNVLSSLSNENRFLLQDKKLHLFAHHLNSSQIMCYNFFRPFIDEDQHPTRDLFSILNTCGVAVPYSDKASCDFEYEQENEGWKDGTNFDFYLTSLGYEVFFEIKYTEPEFGAFKQTPKEIERHRMKYDKIYHEIIDNCPALKKKIAFDDEFCCNYQLIRNTIRVTDKTKFVVFIYDANNSNTYNQLHYFLNEYIANDYKQNVIPLEWQKLILACNPDSVYDFWKKYLSYKI
jgi:hypothetical protein